MHLNKLKSCWSSSYFISIFVQIWETLSKRRGEAYKVECVIPTVKFGGGSIMVWGCMALTGQGIWHICNGRMNCVKYITMLEGIYERSLANIYDNNVEEGTHPTRQCCMPYISSQQKLVRATWYPSHWFVPTITWP